MSPPTRTPARPPSQLTLTDFSVPTPLPLSESHGRINSWHPGNNKLELKFINAGSADTVTIEVMVTGPYTGGSTVYTLFHMRPKPLGTLDGGTVESPSVYDQQYDTTEDPNNKKTYGATLLGTVYSSTQPKDTKDTNRTRTIGITVIA